MNEKTIEKQAMRNLLSWLIAVYIGFCMLPRKELLKLQISIVLCIIAACWVFA